MLIAIIIILKMYLLYMICDIFEVPCISERDRDAPMGLEQSYWLAGYVDIGRHVPFRTGHKFTKLKIMLLY